MADALPNFDDASAWVKIPGVAIFDEHDEPAKDGKVRRFDRAKLLKIAKNCNDRDATGNLCPLALGHTVDDPREDLQPVHVGYARHFAVGWDHKLNRYVIRATYYLRREDADKAKTYPRTSVELWGRDLFFDPISLLRRTPQRDLGQWTYSRNSHQEKLRYSMDDTEKKDAPPAAPPAAAPAAVPPEVEPELEPEHREMADKFWKHYMKTQPCMKSMVDRYAAESAPAPGAGPGMAAVSATNGQPPTSDPDPEKARMQKAQSEIEVSRYARQVDDLTAQVEALKKANVQREQEARVAKYERDLTGLIGQGYAFDLAEEVADSKDMTPDQFGKHVERIKKRYNKRPSGDYIPTAADVGDSLASQRNGMSQQRFQQCTKYQRQHPEMPWKEIMEKAPNE